MNENHDLISIKKFYIFVFFSLILWMIFAYFSLNKHIDQQHTYTKLIHSVGQQRMLSQKIALFTDHIYQHNDKTLIQERERLVTQILQSHEFVIAHLPSANARSIYYQAPNQLDTAYQHYVTLLRQSPNGGIHHYLDEVFAQSSSLLTKLNLAADNFQRESTSLAQSIRYRELLILSGALSTFFIEYLFLLLPILNRMRLKDEQIQGSKERFERIVQHSPDGIQIISVDGQLKMFSNLSAEMLGYTNEEMHQLQISDWDIELSKEQLDALIKKLSADDITLFETRHKRKDGSIYDALISARMIELDNDTYIYASVKDVTELNVIKRHIDIDALKLKIAAQSANMGIWQWNPQSGELRWDEQMHKIFATDTPLTIEEWKACVVESDRKKAVSDLESALVSKRAYHAVFSIVTANDSHRIIEATAKPLFDQHGNVEWLVGTNRDITLDQQRLNKINSLNFQLSLTQNMVQLGYWELNYDTQELFWSDQFYSIFELDKDHIMPSYASYFRLIHPDDRKMVSRVFTHSIVTHEPYNVTHRLLMGDGRIKYVNEIGQSFYNGDGEPISTIGTIMDITVRRRDELEKERYVRLIDKYIVTSETDLNGVITKVSEAFCELTGYSKEELIGHKHNRMRHPDTSDRFYQQLWQNLLAGNTWQSEIKNRNKAGRDYWLKSTFSPIFDESNHKIGYSEVSQDITEKKLAEERAIRDKLTGLFNRLHIDEVTKMEIERERRYRNHLSLMIIDLDFFKKVNDTYGHLAGDKILIQLADILIKNTRVTDCVGRWGGEEFVIICPNTDLRSATILAEKIRTIVETYQFDTVGRLTASFGIAQYRETDNNEKALFVRADKSLYQAKSQGRNQVVAI